MIESEANTLAFLQVTEGYFEINAGNNTLVLTSDEGGPSNISPADGTYNGAGLATALATAMNADDTLTGTGTITFDVTYSSSTLKFTLDATAGKTIAFTLAGSDGAYTFGFSADKSAAQTITSDDAAGDPTAIVGTLLTETEKFVSDFCRRTFESTAYTLERYNGNWSKIINLRQYPATIIDRVVAGTRSAIIIHNTNTGSSASVSVNTTGLRLVLDGTADTSVTFAANATITLIVAAINALGNGWVASVFESSIASFKSSELVTRSAASCINSRRVYLDIPDEAEYDVETDLDKGQIRLPLGFPRGFQNIFVDYTAGYSAADMPADLKLAVKIIVQYLYMKRNNTTYGVNFYNVGSSGSTGIRTIYETDSTFPREAIDILWRYKSLKV